MQSMSGIVHLYLLQARQGWPLLLFLGRPGIHLVQTRHVGYDTGTIVKATALTVPMFKPVCLMRASRA
jgi:hypothetical protein